MRLVIIGRSGEAYGFTGGADTGRPSGGTGNRRAENNGGRYGCLFALRALPQLALRVVVFFHERFLSRRMSCDGTTTFGLHRKDRVEKFSPSRGCNQGGALKLDQCLDVGLPGGGAPPSFNIQKCNVECDHGPMRRAEKCVLYN